MGSDSFRPLQGMTDLTAPEVGRWHRLEDAARHIMRRYGVQEIRTPLLEKTDLFVRSLGDTSEVVRKEMYAFEDRGGRAVALRPEGTAGVIRAVAGMGPDGARARLYYLGPMFRCERPQAGRKRQFHQLGAEWIGTPNPVDDVECIALQMDLLKAWGLGGGCLRLNSLGLPADRQQMVEGLRDALRDRVDELDEDARQAVDRNVLRVLDSKHPQTRAVLDDLPPLSSFYSDEARDYMERVCDLLAFLDVPFEHCPRLVRGLDYYQHTVWEITHPALGAQDALCGGGRYCIEWQGKAVEGVGFAMGMERVLGALGEEGADTRPPYDIWVVSMGDAAFRENLLLTQSLRHQGYACGMETLPRSMKAQMRAAHRSGARRVIIRGEDEFEKGIFLLRNMDSGTQEELDLPSLTAALKKMAEPKISTL